ncbi:FAD-dependent oxidoreductase [Adlercreutzia sp. R21]|uniref:FAD-dependent oxidoreductase n=1 Tax=Adlercreutzia wanghongyangiae TaxID=3111451 RepID=UPI002DBE6771|nr:FAD-dependent oxidoreductase [Adlercreutzia sp. R21]MEC4183459.1 FAD-dependent oxidoreductase [Adlercreutzia sp. R21]
MGTIERRTFLKGALVAGAGAVTALGASACAPQSSQTMAATGEGDADQVNAAGRWSWETPPASVEDFVETLDADIVVVGAGFAGVCAAQSAAEEGASVVVLEKTPQPNGRGLDIGNIGSSWYDEHPELAALIDAADAERIHYEFAHSNVNRLLFRHWAQHSGEAFDHLADYMSSVHGIGASLSATAQTERYDAREYFRELPTCLQFGQGWFDETGAWQMQGVVDKVAQWAQELGATFLFETPVEQLVVDDDGAVTGVIAQGKDGYIRVNARVGVILACGDISGSEEMLEAWCPLGARVGLSVYTPEGVNTGDGIKMGLWAGADVQRGPAAPMIHPMGPGGPLFQSGDLGFLCVNRNGERYTCEFNNTPGMANSRLNQPGGISYTIFDGGFREKALKIRPDNVNVMGMPIVDDTTQATIDEAVAAGDGLCLKADTVEELAELIGADPDTLVATIDRWNALVAQGADDDMMMDGDRLTSLDQPPFYASFNPQANLVVIYGLNCDSHSRVCDKDDRPIGGLYAIGNMQGNFFAVDYPLICPGISHGRCMTFGYTLPKAMLKGELI